MFGCPCHKLYTKIKYLPSVGLNQIVGIIRCDFFKNPLNEPCCRYSLTPILLKNISKTGLVSCLVIFHFNGFCFTTILVIQTVDAFCAGIIESLIAQIAADQKHDLLGEADSELEGLSEFLRSTKKEQRSLKIRLSCSFLTSVQAMP